MKTYSHNQHPHIENRKKKVPAKVQLMHKRGSLFQRLNAMLAVRITDGVSTMWCAYLFAMLALISLPSAINSGTSSLVSWVAQTFLQLVLLSIIMVGQKVAAEASDKRAQDTYDDTEAVLHEILQVHEHLEIQDELLKEVLHVRDDE